MVELYRFSLGAKSFATLYTPSKLLCVLHQTLTVAFLLVFGSLFFLELCFHMIGKCSKFPNYSRWKIQTGIYLPLHIFSSSLHPQHQFFLYPLDKIQTGIEDCRLGGYKQVVVGIFLRPICSVRRGDACSIHCKGDI